MASAQRTDFQLARAVPTGTIRSPLALNPHDDARAVAPTGSVLWPALHGGFEGRFCCEEVARFG